MTGQVFPQEKKKKNQKDPPLHSCDILVLLWWTESGSVPNLILNSKPQCTIKHRTFLWKQTEVECVCTFPEQCLVNSLFSQNCKCNVWTKGTAACHVPAFCRPAVVREMVKKLENEARKEQGTYSLPHTVDSVMARTQNIPLVWCLLKKPKWAQPGQFF